MVPVLDSFILEDKDLLILHSQYTGLGWSCNAWNQDINSYSTDLALLEYSSSSTR